MKVTSAEISSVKRLSIKVLSASKIRRTNLCCKITVTLFWRIKNQSINYPSLHAIIIITLQFWTKMNPYWTSVISIVNVVLISLTTLIFMTKLIKTIGKSMLTNIKKIWETNIMDKAKITCLNYNWLNIPFWLLEKNIKLQKLKMLNLHYHLRTVKHLLCINLKNSSSSFFHMKMYHNSSMRIIL